MDKPGKDNNYRGMTEFGGALYFTKGSGSNGMETVYTVSSLPTMAGWFRTRPRHRPRGRQCVPTLANAGQQVIAILNGFPTDSARASLADGTSGGDYTPFACSLPTSHYVRDR